MKNLILLTALFSALLSTQSFAQSSARQRDTSFTLYSSFLKAKKQNPSIRMVSEDMPKGVKLKSNIRYCTIGTRELVLDVYYPSKRSVKPVPAVVLIHGGGWKSGDKSNNVALAQQLAARGFVAVNVAYRLSDEALYPAAVHDIKAAIRWTRAKAATFGIDPGKIAVEGFSAGGQLAALIGTTNGLSRFEGDHTCTKSVSSDVQAIIDIDGVLAFIHPESGEGDDSKGKSAATLWFGTSKTENPALWEDASALSHVSRKTPPILFINSSISRMHAGRDDMISQLNQWNIYSEVHVFPEAPHVFPLFHPWFHPTVDYIANFLNKVF